MKTIGTIIAVALLAACASKPTYSDHQSIQDSNARSRQLAIDDGQCRQVALGAAPMPQIQVQQDNSATYRTTGSSFVYDNHGNSAVGTYSGTVTKQPTNSFSTGMANGMAMGAAIAAKKDQDKIHHSCMLAKGWISQ